MEVTAAHISWNSNFQGGEWLGFGFDSLLNFPGSCDVFTYNGVFLAIPGSEVTEEVADGDDKLQELIEDEGHEFLAAPSDVPLLELLPYIVGTVQVDQEVNTNENVSGGHGGYGANHSGDEEDIELTDEVCGHQIDRGHNLASCFFS